MPEILMSDREPVWRNGNSQYFTMSAGYRKKSRKSRRVNKSRRRKRKTRSSSYF